MRIRKKPLAAPSKEKRRVVYQEGIFVTTRGQVRGHTALVLNTAARKHYAVYKTERLHVVSPSHLRRKSIKIKRKFGIKRVVVGKITTIRRFLGSSLSLTKLCNPLAVEIALMTFDAVSPVNHAKTPKNADGKGNFRKWFQKCGVILKTLRFQNEVPFENSVERLPCRIRSYHKRIVYPRWRKTL